MSIPHPPHLAQTAPTANMHAVHHPLTTWATTRKILYLHPPSLLRMAAGDPGLDWKQEPAPSIAGRGGGLRR